MIIRGGIATLAILIIIFIALITPSALHLASAETLLTPTSNPLNFSLLPVAANNFDGSSSLPTAVSATFTNTPTQTPTTTLTPMPTKTDTPTITSTPASTNTAVASHTPTLTNTPLPTMTEFPTATKTSTPMNTATSLPPSETGDVRISKIFYNGYVPSVESDEYVEIKNYDTRVILLGGWRVIDGDGVPSVSLPAYEMQPGEICRVYTNEEHSEWCGFNFAVGNAIWNNSGDTAFLKDSYGLVDECSYAGGGDDGAIANCP